jgi:hypothetical protein
VKGRRKRLWDLEPYLARLERRRDFARALKIAVRWYCS